MCEANVYMVDEKGEEQLLLESVDKIEPENEKLFLENIYGQKKIVKAKIKEMELVEHRIILEKSDDSNNK